MNGTLRCVNALNRATLISTWTLTGRMIHCISVNALNRATLISTLPSQNRLFKPLCGLVFARNFQSCLIINYNKGQKWAEGKLFFEYNFEAISIVWLYLQTAAFSTPCPDIDWGIKLGLITSSWQIFIIAGDNPEEIRYYMCWLSNVRLDWDSWSNTTDLRTFRREFGTIIFPECSILPATLHDFTITVVFPLI